MKLPFYKYQGTGNDFVLVDNRQNIFPKNDTKLIAHLCDRRLGVGGDGMILIEEDADVDFKMVYFNADGKESTMCGNGGRCIVQFAKFLNVISDKTTFNAVDGLHTAHIINDEVALGMINVSEVKKAEKGVFLNTGSPHHIQMVKNIDVFNVFDTGRNIRNEIYGADGANVNFVEQISENEFKVRTYERGVEDETLSCGTGVTAVAIAMTELELTNEATVTLQTLGGVLKVSFTKMDGFYKNVVLQGPALQVFKGEIII
ncbi:diaminopimelate epimerase [Patiriisocius marinus]|nr:diaminopimelate epimerase [Patiriisocius marinus]